MTNLQQKTDHKESERKTRGTTDAADVVPAPPAGFDVMTASDDELIRYGYFPRPDEKLPQLRALWEKMVRRNFRLVSSIPPSIDIKETKSLQAQHRQVFERSKSTAYANAWCGATITPTGQVPQVYYYMSGQWTVPSPLGFDAGPASANTGFFSISAWMRLQSSTNPNQGVAVGTSIGFYMVDGVVQPGGQVAWPWYEYGGDIGYNFIENNPYSSPDDPWYIGPGDTISAVIYSPSGNFNSAILQFFDITSGLKSPVIQLSGQPFEANTAQWVLGFLPSAVNDQYLGPVSGNTIFDNVYAYSGAAGGSLATTTQQNLNSSSTATVTFVDMDNSAGWPAVSEELNATSFKIVTCTIM